MSSVRNTPSNVLCLSDVAADNNINRVWSMRGLSTSAEVIVMNVAVTNAAKIAVTTLPDDERRRVHAWFDHLRNWATDPEVRKNSRPVLPDDKHSVYVLRTTSDVRIFFTVDEDQITVVDVARKDSLRTVKAGDHRGE